MKVTMNRKVPMLCTLLLFTANFLGCEVDPMSPVEIEVLTQAEAEEAYQTSVTAGALSSGEAAKYGDLTGDGEINVVDLQCMNLARAAVMGSKPMPKCLTNEPAADLNCDGEINVVDFQLIIQIVISGGPLHPSIDADQNGVHDMCEAAPEEAEGTPLYADVTGDGAINVIDVQCVRATVVAEMQGAEELPQCLTTDHAADLNCDGSNSVVDYQLIVQKVMSDGPLHPAIDADQNGIHDNCQ